MLINHGFLQKLDAFLSNPCYKSWRHMADFCLEVRDRSGGTIRKSAIRGCREDDRGPDLNRDPHYRIGCMAKLCVDCPLYDGDWKEEIDPYMSYYRIVSPCMFMNLVTKETIDYSAKAENVPEKLTLAMRTKAALNELAGDPGTYVVDFLENYVVSDRIQMFNQKKIQEFRAELERNKEMFSHPLCRSYAMEREEVLKELIIKYGGKV